MMLSQDLVGPPEPDQPDPAKTHLVQDLKHTSPLLGCRIDPSGAFVFAGAQDNTVVRWQLADGKKTALAGHKSWVRALAFAADKLAFSGDYTGQLLAWPPTPTRRHRPGRGPPTRVGYAPWRSAPTANCWSRAATTIGSSSGPSPTASRCMSSPDTIVTSTTSLFIPRANA